MNDLIQAAVDRGWRWEYDDTSGLQFPYTWFRPDGKVHDSYEIPGDLPLADIAKFTDHDNQKSAEQEQTDQGGQS